MRTLSYIKIVFFLLFFLSNFTSCTFAQKDTFEVSEVEFQSDGLCITGKLFVPSGEREFPAVVILHGGSSNVKSHRSTSTYFARRFVNRGIAVLIYDKRGTGDSDGEVSKCMFDDYVIDAINAVKFLKQQDKLNPGQVGLFGPSQGGRIAALAAARSTDVAFVVSAAGPLVSIADVCYYSAIDFLNSNDITDSLMNLVNPLWQEHFALVEKRDTTGLNKLDEKIEEFYGVVDTIFLPSKFEMLDSLGDFQPMYNSMSRDYITELSNVKVPWLSIYAEFDNATPVKASIKVLKEQVEIGGNENYEIEIVPNVNHMFIDLETKKYFPFENVAIEWILKLVN
jgi:dienelactone hydrolase